LTQGPWPFDQPPNAAAISLRRIVLAQREGKLARPILYVSHDKDDHGWQFLDGEPVTNDDAALVSMLAMLRHDPTLVEVADLPPGWWAHRKAVGMPWRRGLRSSDPA
jgi:hypothetical protein